MGSLKRRIWKFTAASVAAVLILMAIGVGLFRAAMPFVPTFRVQAEQAAEQALGWPVEIGRMDLQWQFLGPMLVLQEVQLLSPETRQPLVSADRIDLVFRPGDLFQDSDFRPSHIRLHGPALGLERDADNRLMLSGYLIEFDPDSRLEWRTILRRVLKHGRVSIIDGTLHYRDIPLGIDDWSLREFELSVASDGNEHEFTGSFLPPGPLGEQAAFSIEAEGPAGEPEQWRWQASLGARKVRFNWLYEQLRWAGAGRFDGTIDLAADLGGHGMDAVDGAGRFAANAMRFVSAEVALTATDALPPQDFEFDWTLQYSADEWSLALDRLVVGKGVGAWPASRWQLAGQEAASDEGRELRFRAGHLRPQDLLPMLDWLPQQWLEAGTANRIRRLQPHAVIRDLDLETRFLAGELEHWQLSADVTDLAFSGDQDLPGVEGLDFTVNGDRQQGELMLASGGAWLDFRPMFRERIPVDHLQGSINWQQRSDGIHLDVRQLRAENEDAILAAQGGVMIPQQGSVTTTLEGQVFDGKLAAAPRYLPVGIMSDALVRWLDAATPAGVVPKADWVLQGPLQQFPWRDGNGVFDVRFRVEDATLVYQSDWPQVDSATADVHFHQQALDVVARKGSVAGLALDGMQAGFDDLREARLRVNGSTTGDSARGFAFLAASPLQQYLHGLLDNVRPRGPFAAKLELDLPLADLDRGRVEVLAELQGVDAEVGGLPWPARDLRGELRVTRSSVEAEALQGQFTGNPVELQVSSETGADGIGPVSVSLRGRTPVTELASYLPAGWAERLDGSVGWRGELRANVADNPVTLQLESGLAGVSSTLPEPLSVLQAASATLRLPTEEDSGIEAGLQMPGVFAGRLYFSAPQDGSSWRLQRGRIDAGSVELPELPQQPGLVLTGEVEDLPALDWVLLGEDATDAAGQAEDETPLLRAIDLDAGTLHLGHLHFADQRLSGERLEDLWEFSLQGPIQGAARLPFRFAIDTEASLQLERLHIAGDDDAGEAGDAAEDQAPDPRSLPSVRMNIRSLVIDQLDFGHVSGRLQRTAIGLVTDSLIARDAAYQSRVSGRWEFVDNEHYTSMNGSMESSDLEATLARFGFTPGLDAREARVDFNLSWPASPAAWDIGIIEGRFGFDFGDGQLREVSPGAGRMLGLLSITALPRRLLLDFSDLFNEGLAFDSLRGDYLITDGNAYTTNVRLEGASITAYLVGRTGLAQRDYDQVAIVDPGVSSSIPVAGYLAAGPTVGAALLLASQILKSPLSDITQVKYRITGSWDDPVIEPVTSPAVENANEDAQ